MSRIGGYPKPRPRRRSDSSNGSTNTVLVPASTNADWPYQRTCMGRLRCTEPRVAARDYSRRVDLFEYQGKEVFRRFGIPVGEGRLATTREEAREAAEELGGRVVVKAQVLTGGRGKAGGVKVGSGPDEAEQHAGVILGLDIRGHVVRSVWIERAASIAKEYYLSITFDRGARAPLLMLTTRGGVDIEQVAAETPDALAHVHVDPLEG